MNYAVHSAAAVSFSPRRPSFANHFPKLTSCTLPTPARRITINVGGERFQTYEETLARYPDSLLGSPSRRLEFYDFARDEFVFPDCNKEIFNAILFFYQARILSRPEHVPLNIFEKEIEFFELARYSSECTVRADDEKHHFPEYNTFRNRLWNFLEYPRTRQAHLFGNLNLVLVLIWIIMLCVETQVSPTISTSSGMTNTSDPRLDDKAEIPECNAHWEGCLFIIDKVFVLWFTVDYLVHILCAPNVIRYLLSASGLIDILTVLPFYVHLIARHTGTTLSPQMKGLSVLRIFRLFKASRYSSSFRILVRALTSSAQDFPVWIILVIMHIFFFSSILFYVEHDVQNPQFSNIPDVMWFTVITMCAVGYGDIVPQSVLGKFVTSVAAVTGIVIVYCIPAPTLKKNFNRLNELHKSKKAKKNSARKPTGCTQ